jgi:ferric-chelate reductase
MVLDHLRSEIMVLRNGKVIKILKYSLLAMESVKLQNGGPNLSSLLRDEVELATGRMSVSG